MADDKNLTKPNFWTTLPGILTGLAALLTAAGGLYAVLHKANPNSKEPPGIAQESQGTDRKSSSPMTGPTSTPANPSGSEAGSAQSTTTPPSREPPPTEQKPQTVITERDGSVVSVDTETLRWVWAPKPNLLDLTNGRTIPLDKIKIIDFSEVDSSKTSVQITLIDNTTITGSLGGGTFDTSNAFEGHDRQTGSLFHGRTSILQRIAIGH